MARLHGRRRRTAAHAEPLGGTYNIGDLCEVLWMDSNGNEKWWQAKIIDKRKLGADRPLEYRYHFVGSKSTKNDAWIDRLDAAGWIRPMPILTWAEGDEYAVECILDERDEGSGVEYLVRWAGFQSDGVTKWPDDWISSDDVGEKAISDWQWQKDQPARDERAQRARDGLELVRSKLVAKLKATTASKARSVLHNRGTLELCEDWRFIALHEWLKGQVPTSADMTTHLTEIEQPVGKRGTSQNVVYQFHVRSHGLIARLLDFGDEDELRKEHVVYHTHGLGTAVAYDGPMTFTRRGPRAKPHEMRLMVSSSIVACVGRNHQQPDWRAKDKKGQPATVPASIKRPIARRILDIESRHTGTVNGAMLVECNNYDM